MKTLYVILGLALVLAAVPAGAVTMAEVISGNLFPLKLRLGDMKTGWFQYTPDEGHDPASSFLRMVAFHDETPPPSTVCYTQGQIVTVEKQSYLIAYRVPSPQIDFATMMHMQRGGDGDEQEAEPEPLTLQTETTMSLFNLSLCGHLLDIQPFSPEKLKEAEKPIVDGQPNPAEIKRLQSKTMNNQRQIAVGIMAWAQDRDEEFPKMDDLATLRKTVNLPEKIWTNPFTNKPFGVNKEMSEKALGEIEDPTTVVLVFDTEPWPDGKRCAAFVDGHVEMITDKRWQEIQKAMNAAQDPAAAKRREMERTLKQNLSQLRTAVEQFQADTGVYPEKLADLLLPKDNGPKRGLTQNGKIVLLTEGYAGPYLKEMPVNPLIDPAAANFKEPDAHWSYGKEELGMVRAVNPQNGATIEGRPYQEL